MKKNNAPAIVLVRPQMPENIGAAARAMSNFGLTDLRLVNPRDGWPSARAREVSSGGENVIDRAKVFETVHESLDDCRIAYATTGRDRDISKRVITMKEAMAEIAAMKNKAAILFGPERTGLENDDMVLADTFISIPTAPEHASLNLAQSVVIAGYEWWQAQGEKRSPDKLPDIAPLADWQGLFEQMESYLEESTYFRVRHKKQVMWQNIRTMFLRARFSKQEIRTFRGMLRVLCEGRKHGSRVKQKDRA